MSKKLNTQKLSAYQLARIARKNMGGYLLADAEMKNRQTLARPRCALPKKQQRALGLLPPVKPV